MVGEFFEAKVGEYVRRFGGAGNFFGKVLGCLNFDWCLIRVADMVVELSNREGFVCEVGCDEFFDDEEYSRVEGVAREKRELVFDGDGKRVFLFPIFGDGDVVSVIRYELPFGREGYDEIFREVLQGSRDLVYRYDFVENKFLYVSESVWTLFGFGLAEFVKFGWDDFLGRVHEDDSAGVSEDEGGVCVREFRWRCKDDEFRWFSDRRISVFDDSGKVVGIIGCVRDIGKERAVREEAERLGARVDYMRREDVVSKVSLTVKEQKVLWGLCRFPLLNDVELAERLKLKRSTLTAIKNRLNKGGWFRMVYVPNFNKLGCDYAGLFYGGLSKKTRKFDFDFVRGDDNVVFRNLQDDKFFGVYVSRRVLDFRKFIRDFAERGEGVDLSNEEFFYSLDNFEFRDCSSFVDSIFGLGFARGPSGFGFSNSEVDLNVNERRVLHAMVTNPDLTSAEIAKRVWVSNPTVIKVRNKLLEEGVVYPYVAVDFRKLGFGFVGRISCSFDSDVGGCPLNGGYDSRVLFRIRGKGRVVDFVLFSSEKKFCDELGLMREAYRKKGVYVDLEGEVFAIQKRGKNMLGLDGFVEDLLFEGVSLSK